MGAHGADGCRCMSHSPACLTHPYKLPLQWIEPAGGAPRPVLPIPMLSLQPPLVFSSVPFPALVPSFLFCTWQSLRWGMSGLTSSDLFSWQRLNCPEL
eukprot:365481-Chlamydomonas_euryale.AAC.1